MISSRHLAKKLIYLVKKGINPQEVSARLKKMSSSSEIKSVLPHILFYLEKYQKEEKKRVEGNVVLAHEFSKEIEDSFGDRVSHTPSVLGGVKVVKHGKLYDSTLAHSLKALIKSLN